MNEMYERLQLALSAIRKKTDFVPKIGIVLGSGLGDFAKNAKTVATLSYGEIDGFPVSTVKGHAGKFLFGYVNEVPVVIMQGRVHYYEGYSMEDVVLPIRLIGMLGAKALILTNAAGGVNLNYSAGTLMAITDHIELAPNPLIGQNMEEIGERFPDMTEIYDRKFLQLAEKVAIQTKIKLEKGVYVQLTGPSYESPAEVRMCRILGADAVGMSTACEAIAARHMDLRVAGISCISNMAAGITGEKLSHAEVQSTADRVKGDFVNLLQTLVFEMGKEL